MAFESIATLKFIWDFVSPIFGDLLKDKLSGLEKSDKKAKKKVFELYQQLEKVSFATNEFTTTFEQFVKFIVADLASTKEFKDSKQELLNDIDELNNELNSTARMLSAIEIQLKVHLPDFLKDFYNYQGMRGENLRHISERLEVLNQFIKVNKEEVLLVLEKTKYNNELINGGIEKLRLFIVKEFSFKESF